MSGELMARFSDEERARRAQIMRERRRDPEFHAKMKKGMKKSRNTEEYKQKQSERMREVWRRKREEKKPE